MLELWGMRSTPSLPSLVCPLWLEVVASDRVLSMGQIELNYVLMLNWIVWKIGLMGRVFANDPKDRGSIPGRVIPKTQKMLLDTALLNSQHYKINIKGKVEQSREKSNALHPGVVAIEKGVIGSISTKDDSIWMDLALNNLQSLICHKTKTTLIL